MTFTDETLKIIAKEGRQRMHAKMPPIARLRMLLVVMSVGAGAMFLLSLDSVVDNLQPVAVPFLLRIYNSKEIADIAWEWIVSSRIYGLAIGCLIALLLANCQSRKRPFIGALLINFLGGVVSALIIYMPYNEGVILCCIGRFACGIGCGIAQVVGSAMLAEIPPVHSRGTVLATLTVWSCMGELGGMIISLDNLLGRPSTWHIALAAPSLIVPFILVFILPAPDSPRSLLMAGRSDEALAALKFYQCSADWPASFADINAEARNLARAERNRRTGSPTAVVTSIHKSKKEMYLTNNGLHSMKSDGYHEEFLLREASASDVDSGHHSSSDEGSDSDSALSGDCEHSQLTSDDCMASDNVLLCNRLATPSKPTAIWKLMIQRFRSGTFVRPLAMGAFVLTFAHLDDWLWISYSTPIFENVGMHTGEAMRASLTMSFPQALISILLLFGFDEFSRRWLLILPTLASIGIAATGTIALMTGQKNFFGGMLSLKTLIAGLAALDLSAAAIASESAYTVVPELFSQTDRVLGSAIIGFLQNFFGGFLTTFALSVINLYGTQFVLLPFAFMNVAYIMVIYRCLPETSGISFHKISQNFKEELPYPFCLAYALLGRIAHFFSRLATVFSVGLGACFTRVPFLRHYAKPSAGGIWTDSLRRAFVTFAQFAFCALCIHIMVRIVKSLIQVFNVSDVSSIRTQ